MGPWRPMASLHGTLLNDHFVHSILQGLPQLSPLLLRCLGDLGTQQDARESEENPPTARAEQDSESLETNPAKCHTSQPKSGTNQHEARADIVDRPNGESSKPKWKWPVQRFPKLVG